MGANKTHKRTMNNNQNQPPTTEDELIEYSTSLRKNLERLQAERNGQVYIDLDDVALKPQFKSASINPRGGGIYRMP